MILIVLGVGFFIHLMRKPIEIKFEYSWMSWVGPILLSYALFLAAVLIEYVFSKMICNRINAETQGGFWVKVIFENGVLIPVLCFGLSVVFGMLVKTSDLDYMDFYSDMLVKICFTVFGVVGCIILFVKAHDAGIEYSGDTFLAGRVVMWLLAIVSIWLYFGRGCESRAVSLRKELVSLNEMDSINSKSVNKLESGTLSIKAKVRQWGPFVWPIAFCVIITLLTLFEGNGIKKLELLFCTVMLAVSIIAVFVMLIFKRILNPSEKNSEKDFDKVVDVYNKHNRSITKRFGINRYHFENGKLIVEKCNVKYAGHENDKEFIELFVTPCHDVEIKNQVKDYVNDLKALNKKQKAYMLEMYQKCIEEQKIRKMNIESN